jgi:hypothetical protein
VLGEEDLSLMSRRFKHMYMNWKNAWRSSGMCYECEKHGHFIAECPEAVENKVDHKHHPKIDHKHCSRNNYKNKNKSEHRLRKSGCHKKKTECAMVAGASDIVPSSCYTSSSSSDEEEDGSRYKGKRSSKNFNGLCFAAQGFCCMAHCFGSKKSGKDDSDSDSELARYMPTTGTQVLPF